jgi:hypothetical protein
LGFQRSIPLIAALNRAKRAIKPADDEDVAIGFHKDGIALSIRRGNADCEYATHSVSAPAWAQGARGICVADDIAQIVMQREA